MSNIDKGTRILNIDDRDPNWVKILTDPYIPAPVGGYTKGLLSSLQEFYNLYALNPANIREGFDFAGTIGNIYQVKVSEDDLQGYLGDKITVSNGLTLTINGSSNEVIDFALDIQESDSTSTISLLQDGKTVKKLTAGTGMIVTPTSTEIDFKIDEAWLEGITYGIKYAWDNETEMFAETGMSDADLGVRNDLQEVWRYDEATFEWEYFFKLGEASDATTATVPTVNPDAESISGNALNQEVVNTEAKIAINDNTDDIAENKGYIQNNESDIVDIKDDIIELDIRVTDLEDNPSTGSGQFPFEYQQAEYDGIETVTNTGEFYSYGDIVLVFNKTMWADEDKTNTVNMSPLLELIQVGDTIVSTTENGDKVLYEITATDGTDSNQWIFEVNFTGTPSMGVGLTSYFQVVSSASGSGTTSYFPLQMVYSDSNNPGFGEFNMFSDGSFNLSNRMFTSADNSTVEYINDILKNQDNEDSLIISDSNGNKSVVTFTIALGAYIGGTKWVSTEYTIAGNITFVVGEKYDFQFMKTTDVVKASSDLNITLTAESLSGDVDSQQEVNIEFADAIKDIKVVEPNYCSAVNPIKYNFVDGDKYFGNIYLKSETVWTTLNWYANASDLDIIEAGGDIMFSEVDNGIKNNGTEDLLVNVEFNCSCTGVTYDNTGVPILTRKNQEYMIGVFSSLGNVISSGVVERLTHQDDEEGDLDAFQISGSCKYELKAGEVLQLGGLNIDVDTEPLVKLECASMNVTEIGSISSSGASDTRFLATYEATYDGTGNPVVPTTNGEVRWTFGAGNVIFNIFKQNVDGETVYNLSNITVGDLVSVWVLDNPTSRVIEVDGFTDNGTYWTITGQSKTNSGTFVDGDKIVIEYEPSNENAGVTDHTLLTNIGTKTHDELESDLAFLREDVDINRDLTTENATGITNNQVSIVTVSNRVDELQTSDIESTNASTECFNETATSSREINESLKSEIVSNTDAIAAIGNVSSGDVEVLSSFESLSGTADNQQVVNTENVNQININIDNILDLDTRVTTNESDITSIENELSNLSVETINPYSYNIVLDDSIPNVGHMSINFTGIAYDVKVSKTNEGLAYANGVELLKAGDYVSLYDNLDIDNIITGYISNVVDEGSYMSFELTYDSIGGDQIADAEYILDVKAVGGGTDDHFDLINIGTKTHDELETEITGLDTRVTVLENVDTEDGVFIKDKAWFKELTYGSDGSYYYKNLESTNDMVAVCYWEEEGLFLVFDDEDDIYASVDGKDFVLYSSCITQPRIISKVGGGYCIISQSQENVYFTSDFINYELISDEWETLFGSIGDQDHYSYYDVSGTYGSEFVVVGRFQEVYGATEPAYGAFRVYYSSGDVSGIGWFFESVDVNDRVFWSQITQADDLDYDFITSSNYGGDYLRLHTISGSGIWTFSLIGDIPYDEYGTPNPAYLDGIVYVSFYKKNYGNVIVSRNIETSTVTTYDVPYNGPLYVFQDDLYLNANDIMYKFIDGVLVETELDPNMSNRNPNYSTDGEVIVHETGGIVTTVSYFGEEDLETLDNLDNRVTQNKDDITDIDTRVSANESDIIANTGNIVLNASDIADNATNIGVNALAIDALDTRVTDLEDNDTLDLLLNDVLDESMSGDATTQSVSNKQFKSSINGIIDYLKGFAGAQTSLETAPGFVPVDIPEDNGAQTNFITVDFAIDLDSTNTDVIVVNEVANTIEIKENGSYFWGSLFNISNGSNKTDNLKIATWDLTNNESVYDTVDGYRSVPVEKDGYNQSSTTFFTVDNAPIVVEIRLLADDDTLTLESWDGVLATATGGGGGITETTDLLLTDGTTESISGAAVSQKEANEEVVVGVNTNESDITVLDGRVTTNETDITTLEGTVGNVGTKEVDETNIADGNVATYDLASDKVVYTTPSSGGGSKSYFSLYSASPNLYVRIKPNALLEFYDELLYLTEVDPENLFNVDITDKLNYTGVDKTVNVMVNLSYNTKTNSFYQDTGDIFYLRKNGTTVSTLKYKHDYTTNYAGNSYISVNFDVITDITDGDYFEVYRENNKTTTYYSTDFNIKIIEL